MPWCKPCLLHLCLFIFLWRCVTAFRFWLWYINWFGRQLPFLPCRLWWLHTLPAHTQYWTARQGLPLPILSSVFYQSFYFSPFLGFMSPRFWARTSKHHFFLGEIKQFQIALKDFYLFKIAESIISFCLKKKFNSAILNWWKPFSKMVDHVTYRP